MLVLNWSDFDDQPQRIYFSCASERTRLAFGSVGFLPLSILITRIPTYLTHSDIYIRSISGATRGLASILNGLRDFIAYCFVFFSSSLLEMVSGAASAAQTLCRCAARGLIFIFRSTPYSLSRRLERQHWMLREDGHEASFEDFPSGSSLKRGPVCEEVLMQTHQRGQITAAKGGEFNCVTEWESVRFCCHEVPAAGIAAVAAPKATLMQVMVEMRQFQ